MLEHRSLRPNSETRFVPLDSTRAVAIAPVPRRNRLLAALPRDDYKRIYPNLEPVPLSAGCTVCRPGKREKHLYFLTAGAVSQFYVTESGASAEFALTGSEGVIGIASFLGGGSTLNQTVVLHPGYAYRLKVDRVHAEFENAGALAQILLRYTQSLITQIGQIAVCNRCHRLEQRLCRWILSYLDRLTVNELTMTHELLAEILGVRREAVTVAAGMLKKAGIIQFRRGHIAVLDHPQLETRACECYEVINREYARLLPPG